VLSGRGLCDGLITRPEESYRLWCVVVCDVETSWMRRPWPTGGAVASKTNASLKSGRGQDAESEKFRQHNPYKELRATTCSVLRFLDHTLSALGRTPLDEGSALRRDL
jgi:hypothetical protein